MTVIVDELDIADPADVWTRAGFSIGADSICRIGGVRIRMAGRERGTGVIGWSLRGLPDDVDRLDGVPTARSDTGSVAPAVHANGVMAIDHVVLLSPDLHRTVESFAGVGL
ncbi:glyoxalase, partial [Mycobacterium sp. ITM-2017-0098]